MLEKTKPAYFCRLGSAEIIFFVKIRFLSNNSKSLVNDAGIFVSDILGF